MDVFSKAMSLSNMADPKTFGGSSSNNWTAGNSGSSALNPNSSNNFYSLVSNYKLCGRARKNPLIAEVEERLYDWISEQQTLHENMSDTPNTNPDDPLNSIVLNGAKIRSYALEVYTQILQEKIAKGLPGIEGKLDEFKASKGWYVRFMRRFHLYNMRNQLQSNGESPLDSPSMSNINNTSSMLSGSKVHSKSSSMDSSSSSSGLLNVADLIDPEYNKNGGGVDDSSNSNNINLSAMSKAMSLFLEQNQSSSSPRTVSGGLKQECGEESESDQHRTQNEDEGDDDEILNIRSNDMHSHVVGEVETIFMSNKHLDVTIYGMEDDSTTDGSEGEKSSSYGVPALRVHSLILGAISPLCQKILEEGGSVSHPIHAMSCVSAPQPPSFQEAVESPSSFHFSSSIFLTDFSVTDIRDFFSMIYTGSTLVDQDKFSTFAEIADVLQIDLPMPNNLEEVEGEEKSNKNGDLIDGTVGGNKRRLSEEGEEDVEQEIDSPPSSDDMMALLDDDVNDVKIEGGETLLMNPQLILEEEEEEKAEEGYDAKPTFVESNSVQCETSDGQTTRVKSDLNVKDEKVNLNPLLSSRLNGKMGDGGGNAETLQTADLTCKPCDRTFLHLGAYRQHMTSHMVKSAVPSTRIIENMLRISPSAAPTGSVNSVSLTGVSLNKKRKTVSGGINVSGTPTPPIPVVVNCSVDSVKCEICDLVLPSPINLLIHKQTSHKVVNRAPTS